MDLSNSQKLIIILEKDNIFKGNFSPLSYEERDFKREICFTEIKMVRRKEIRTRGKFSFKRFFQKFVEGDSVAIVRERAIDINFPTRMQGRTGIVQGKRGRAYVVKIKDQNKLKTYLIDPIHLKRIAQESKK